MGAILNFVLYKFLSRSKMKNEIFVRSRISYFLRPAQCYCDCKLIRITCQAACHGTTEHVNMSSLKNRAKLLLFISDTPCPRHIIWCRSTFGPRDPDLSNPTSFLRPALPMAPTTDNNARDEWSVLRPNLATFLRDFTLYMTTIQAIIRKRCLN